jgi:hypothetical protein
MTISDHLDKLRERNTIDEVIIFEGAFGVVLNGGNLGILPRHFQLELELKEWHGLGYLEVESLLEHGSHEV